MAKQSPAEPPAAGPSGAARGKGKKRRRKKRKALGEAAGASKGPGMAAAGPPRNPQEFSSNWKALQELLKQKANNSKKPISTGQTDTKKKQPLKAAKNPEIPAVNGNVVKAKSTNKMDSGSAKASPPLAKPESKGVAAKKNLNCTKSNEKGCKEKKKNGIVVKEKDELKHKRRKAEEHVEQQPKEADIWFDDVDPKDIEAALGPEAAKIARRNLGLEAEQSQSVEQVLVKEKAFEGLTRAVAMDCEMVGVGPKGEDSILARVSIVNQFGKCVYDKYVKPTEKVTDYRTAVSGIRPQNINTGEDFKTVQKEVAEILQGRILVGHALRNDLKVLLLDHPHKKIRDTQRYKPFKQRVKSSRPSLKLLCEKLLNVQVQTAEHCSIQDAQAAMRLYTLEKKKWEAAVKNKANNKNCKT
ncbi:RNA exonuclease 4 [Lonchura striata]|uniref:RNA exonuclease 4 n=1 Tax=Lonchura striata TaxID=40157 RepID=A0A218V702_9PASE|nr:RNA exonuclease 4 [Lonchura striata domestica]OWK61342.1 RNA exonuclease 4 [Lonchura striata domestica]